MKETKEIFISYKNDGEGNNFAGRLSDRLVEMGYRVYYNPNEQNSGSFPDRLQEAVKNCKVFVLVLTKRCLKQLIRHRKVDWIREELLTARKHGKKIIPLLMPGVSMPKDKRRMPKDLDFLPYINAISIYDTDSFHTCPLITLTEWFGFSPEMISKNKEVYQSNPKYKIEEEYNLLEQKAQNGDYQAMYELATYYMYHLGEPDNERAYYWYSQVLASNDEELRAHALSRIAGMYFSGVIPGEEQSFEKAYEIREEAGKYDRNAAMINAAMRSIGSGSEFDYEMVEEGFKKLLTADGICIKDLAEFYLIYGKFKEAIELFKKIDDKMAYAAYQLGKLYKLGVHEDPPKPDCFRAREYFQRAANGGYKKAEYELGMLYYNPPKSDFKKDFKQAVEHFKIAADSGHAEAQYKLGWMYRHGLGCDVNIQESIKYQEMGARQGHIAAHGQLAYLYQYQGFVDYEKAFINAKKAGDGAYAQGAFICGNLLFWGRGCEANESEALKYYKKAYENGSYEAKLMIDKIEKNLSGE